MKRVFAYIMLGIGLAIMGFNVYERFWVYETLTDAQWLKLSWLDFLISYALIIWGFFTITMKGKTS